MRGPEKFGIKKKFGGGYLRSRQEEGSATKKVCMKIGLNWGKSA